MSAKNSRSAKAARRANRERGSMWRDHSVALNQVVWRLGAAMGEVAPDADSFILDDPLLLVDRVIARLAAGDAAIEAVRSSQPDPSASFVTMKNDELRAWIKGSGGAPSRLWKMTRDELLTCANERFDQEA